MAKELNYKKQYVIGSNISHSFLARDWVGLWQISKEFPLSTPALRALRHCLKGLISEFCDFGLGVRLAWGLIKKNRRFIFRDCHYSNTPDPDGQKKPWSPGQCRGTHVFQCCCLWGGGLVGAPARPGRRSGAGGRRRGGAGRPPRRPSAWGGGKHDQQHDRPLRLAAPTGFAALKTRGPIVLAPAPC